jgi:hypothetical protein
MFCNQNESANYLFFQWGGGGYWCLFGYKHHATQHTTVQAMDTKLDPKWEGISSLWLCSCLLGIVEEKKQVVFEKKINQAPC